MDDEDDDSRTPLDFVDIHQCSSSMNQAGLLNLKHEYNPVPFPPIVVLLSLCSMKRISIVNTTNTTNNTQQTTLPPPLPPCSKAETAAFSTIFLYSTRAL